MLLSIREKAQSWIMWVIIILLILMFGLWGISYYLTGTIPSERAVATVNGQNIPNYRFQSMYYFLKQKAGLSAPSATEQAILKREALKQLIDKALMMQQAHNLGMGISQQAVNTLVYQLPAFQSKGKFDPRLLQAYLQSMGMNEQEFQKSLLEELMVSQLMRGIMLSQFILPNEAQHFARLAAQQRDVSYHIIPARDFRAHARPSNTEIEHYYQTHKQDFMTTERTKVAYIDLSLNAVKKTINPTETDLMNYYQNHSDQFHFPGKRKGDMVLVSSLLGISKVQLMVVAKKVATDWAQNKPLNQIQHELGSQHIILSQTPLDWISWHKGQNAVHAALFSLKHNGQVSPPIDTDKGVALIKLIAIQPGKLRSYTQVKQAVRDAYIHEQAQQKLSNMANQLANITFEHNRGLEVAAKALGVPVKTTGYVTQAGAHTGILTHKKVIDTVFNPDVLVQGNNSDLIQISPEEVVVVRAVDYQSAKVKPLAQVRPQIITVLTQQDSTRLAMHQANELVQVLQKDSNAHHGGTWQSKQLTRKSSNVDSALLASVFTHGMPKQGKPLVFAVKLSDGNAAVVKLLSLSIKHPSAADQQIYQSALRQLYAVTLLNDFVATAKHQATIQYTKNIQIN